MLFMLPAAVFLLSSSPIRSGSASGSASPTRRSAGRHLHRARELSAPLWTTASSGSSVFNTILYTVVASILKFGLGLWLALLLNEHLPFKSFFRAIVLLPWVVPTVLSAIAFWWIYDAQFSIISWALMKLGLIDCADQLPRRPEQRPRFGDRRQCLARHPLRRDLAARRPADHPAVALRGGDARRRHRAGSASATSRCRCSRRSSPWS